MALTVSEEYFKYSTTADAKLLRSIYGPNGYKKYVAKINSVMTNPLEESHQAYTQAKAEQYKHAKAHLKNARTAWNEYKARYNNNLAAMAQNNNGFSLSSTQRHQAMQAAGSGAVQAFTNLQEAVSNEDYALSLYNEATHSNINFLG